MAEKEPPPKSKEPSRKTEASEGPPGEPPDITKAKEVIEGVTSENEAVRKETIRKFNLRNPPLGDLAKAKESLVSFDNINWLYTDANQIQYSPEVARFASDIANAGDLAKDPRWLLYKTVELAYSARSEATFEARREINSAIVKVGNRLQELMRDQVYEGVTNTTFDEALYGSPMRGPILSGKDSAFNEEKPDEETVTDPELIRLLREINKKIRTDRAYLSNPEYIERDIQQLRKIAGERNVPESQIKDAIGRLRDIQKSMTEVTEKQGPMRRGELYVTYDEMKGTLLAEDQKPHDFQQAFPFYSITPAEVLLLKQGEPGQQQFFYEFVSKIYSMGRTPERAELPDMQKWDEFSNFIAWLYPENTNYHLGKYDYMWKEMPKHYQIVKNLLFTPGKIEDKLRNLQFLTPADMDHYIKNITHANYALSLYEDAVFDKLSERQVKYKEALNYLKPNAGRQPIERYKELVQKKRIGRLDGTEELEFQQLQEKVDTVGYGVNLWDEDVQNYTELDLEINEMSRELDRLHLKMENPEAGKDPLDEWEKERMKTLEGEIQYKQKRAQEAKKIEGYGQELKKSQHDNRGLSPIDIETKERLRILLESRGGIEPKEWELNQAVWAARQWMIGSSRLASISSGMAIRPGAEFYKIVNEVEGGKYAMKAPAFEDLQRLINPELFQTRFGIGDKMGEVFRAITDYSLLESKGYIFENDSKYRKPDEKDLDPIVRKTREFARQVEEKTGLPKSELLTQGVFAGGGIFDKTMWRAEMATVDEIRKKYLSMKLDVNARIDNQALGIQLLLNEKNQEGKKGILLRMVRRNPSKLFHLLGEPVEALYDKYNLTDEERKAFRKALSVAQINTWDVTGQQGDRKKLAFRDVNMLEEADFNELLRPYLKKDFSDGRIGDLLSLLKEADIVFQTKVDALARHNFPITLTMTDVDWKDASLFQTGTISLDRRARDMQSMAAARDLWIKMHKPEVLCNKDPKETLKILKEYRERVNDYTPGSVAEQATYQVAKAWLNFNRNRMIHFEWEHPEGYIKALPKLPGAFLKSISGWVPFVHPIIKNLSEVDTQGGLISRLVGLQVGPKDNKRYFFGEKGKEFVERLEKKPRELSQNISYAVRYTGAKGNAFEEKQIDEILDQMLQMGIFNSEEGLYHKLRREMKAGLGSQVVGLIRKYWWLLPLLTAAYGAKEGIEEEKKR